MYSKIEFREPGSKSMNYQMNDRQELALKALHDIYKFTRPGRTISKSEMLDILFAFADRFENEFEDFVAGAYDRRMAQDIDAHITSKWEAGQ